MIKTLLLPTVANVPELIQDTAGANVAEYFAACLYHCIIYLHAIILTLCRENSALVPGGHVPRPDLR